MDLIVVEGSVCKERWTRWAQGRHMPWAPRVRRKLQSELAEALPIMEPVGPTK